MKKTVTLLAALALVHTGVQAQANGNPLKRKALPTTAAINEEDLKTRLYIFADDSMMGRQAGREGNKKGTDYIARELARLGVKPGGENGTYFQRLPSVVRKYESWSSLTVDGRKLKWNDDFVAVPGTAAPRQFTRAEVIYGGIAGDTTVTPEQAKNKIIVFAAAPAPAGGGGRAGGGGGFGGGASNARYADAAAIATINLDGMTPSQKAIINNPMSAIEFPRVTSPIVAAQQAAAQAARAGGAGAAGQQGGRAGGAPQGGRGAGGPAQAAGPQPASLRLTSNGAAVLFGRSVDGLTVGTAGRTVDASLAFVEKQETEYARNVIGIVPGSDPALRAEYVAVGAHNDHVGFNANPIDHDSARAYAQALLEATMVGSDFKALSAEERTTAMQRGRVMLDSIRKLRPVRRDSINNGADDDGSGSMAVLEIAEAIAKMPVKPKRSTIFVWHTGEERGLLGAAYFTQYPTVPRDSIVAQINIDMIGRGRTNDIPGGSPDYLAVVGANRLSSELGQMVEGNNRKLAKPLKFDYRFDEPVSGAWSAYNNIYGRSDHARYADWGIPIVFFFTGLHADYHRPTDEPQYIDYPHYSRITNYVRDLVVDVGNKATRPALDKPKT